LVAKCLIYLRITGRKKKELIYPSGQNRITIRTNLTTCHRAFPAKCQGSLSSRTLFYSMNNSFFDPRHSRKLEKGISYPSHLSNAHVMYVIILMQGMTLPLKIKLIMCQMPELCRAARMYITCSGYTSSECPTCLKATIAPSG
jgi:hypothetical protein